ncbi:restriction endonuclease [Desulfitobacterium hafniense DP7]|uniref:Restriction endonuclease n=1 Tax=Desulfitobacterium hafniense DP7 TaxID=537010 RepID=G9XTS6_DESHA|nr:restriction endonuclease [Desulfitobacterium hafniense]EHL04971.1 restriction endonuclease [Desulfitobacterium hafniense DP7]
MYWLLSPTEQEEIRDKITNLTFELSRLTDRDQADQIFPFVGRKDRRTARAIINNLALENGRVADPFAGSGIFAYAALDEGREVYANEWEPFAYRLSTAPFRTLPKQAEIEQGLNELEHLVGHEMRRLYRTVCPTCGKEHVIDGLFYDRDPEEYFNPTRHERMGPNGENIIFRGRYKCSCKTTQKQFDTTDSAHLNTIKAEAVIFPNNPLIENSRINFTAPDFILYGNLFPHRSKLVLIRLRDAIGKLSINSVREFFYDAFLSILQLAKYTDYRSKSQDPHCPPKMLKETNLYHRLVEKINQRFIYLSEQNFDVNKSHLTCTDFRDFINNLQDGEIDLILTDPPYGDSVQYFELAQRFHPFMGYTLATDTQRLEFEVVVSNAPSRPNKKGRQQFLNDIETFFEKSNRVVKDHGYLVLYFRPEQTHWVADLNQLKVYGRRHGFEPLITIDVAQNDPSMRVLASTAWTFAKDVCFIFLKLRDSERRWYEADVDLDEVIYLAAREAAGDRGQPFSKVLFNTHLQKLLREHGLMRLSSPIYSDRIEKTLQRFSDKHGGQYILTGESPYELMHFGIDPELRLREFVPVVVEELTEHGQTFTFEEFILRLCTYLDNGNRKIIQRLHALNSLIPDLLLAHAAYTPDHKAFQSKSVQEYIDPECRTNLMSLEPYEFEGLIAEFFKRRGFTNVSVIGRSRDRGVDIIATGVGGDIHLIQCKRWRKGNNVGSTAIQRVDSYKRTRNADQAWIITTSDFTPEGADEGRITHAHLINGRQLINSLEGYFPGRFYLP